MIPDYARFSATLLALLNESLSGMKRRNKAHGSKVSLADKGWNAEHAEVFDVVKAVVARAATNAHPRQDWHYCLWTDASATSWGAVVLTQVSPEQFHDPVLSWNDWKCQPRTACFLMRRD